MTPVEFKAYVFQLAERIGVAERITSIHLRVMKKKIASCSSKGRLTFDPSILVTPPSRTKEIVTHELLHLRYPNHGKMFRLLFTLYQKDRSYYG